MIGALRGTTLSGHPRHVLPVEINILGLLAGKGTDGQKKPAQRQKYDRGIGIGHQCAETEHIEGVQSWENGCETVADAVSARADSGTETLRQVGCVHSPDRKREHHDKCDDPRWHFPQAGYSSPQAPV